MTYDEYVAAIIYHLTKLQNEIEVFDVEDRRQLKRRVERMLQLVDQAQYARLTTPRVP